MFKLFFEFWSFQEFLFEVQLSVKICSMIIETIPHIIDSVSKSFKLFASYWKLFDDTMFEFLLLERNQILQLCNLIFIIF